MTVADANGRTTDESGGGQTADPVIIKKYANRRLYNTASSSYVTLDHLSEMVRDGVDFVVQDAKSGDDITRSVLTQIIFEQESRGQALLPVQFLRRIIRFYGDQMQGFLPPYLEMSMESFARAQEQMRENFSRAFGATTPLAAFEEQTQRNMAMFQQAMRMWTPFAQKMPGMAMPDFSKMPGFGEMPGAANVMGAPEADQAKDEELAELRQQMAAMQEQLEALARGKS
ncbi:MAG: polyhydroxyalkanoate synthesis repressor PhaR [Hyphomonadaceae bacterium]|nr:polyhydroxyalkanoate synthesis repressor PhaR [Hyphomonadaceae bacterium]